MEYLLEYSNLFKKQLKKLDSSLRLAIIKKVNKLKYNPTINKNKGGKFYELYCKNYRVYYKVLHGIITLQKITYTGTVRLERIGTKNSQKRDISKL